MPITVIRVAYNLPEVIIPLCGTTYKYLICLLVLTGNLLQLLVILFTGNLLQLFTGS